MRQVTGNIATVKFMCVCLVHATAYSIWMGRCWTFIVFCKLKRNKTTKTTTAAATAEHIHKIACTQFVFAYLHLAHSPVQANAVKGAFLSTWKWKMRERSFDWFVKNFKRTFFRFFFCIFVNKYNEDEAHSVARMKEKSKKHFFFSKQRTYICWFFSPYFL